MDERYPYTLTHSDDRSPTKDSGLVLIYRGKIRIFLQISCFAVGSTFVVLKWHLRRERRTYSRGFLTIRTMRESR